ncbi:MAG: peptidoglycan editing factor PgeF [Bacillota bacterium]
MAGSKNGFALIKRGELAYLQSPLLNASRIVDHAFSTRLGGCSTGAAASLNTAFHTDDQFERVMENRRRLLEPWGYDAGALVAGIQVHGTTVALVTEKDRGRGALPRSYLSECDALVTAVPGLVLTAYAADCLLLFLAAPRERVIALAHAGWRGTLGNMAGTVVKYLAEHFAVAPGGILAALSPGICRQCYQVNEAVADQFHSAGWGGPPYLAHATAGEYHLDLPAINATQLRRAGIRAESLAEAAWCTACRPDLFYSYRRDQGATGRMIGFMAISPVKEGCSG